MSGAPFANNSLSILSNDDRDATRFAASLGGQMLADTGRNEVRHVRPGALRDLKRDWESWSLPEKIVMAMIASCALAILSLTHLFGTI